MTEPVEWVPFSHRYGIAHYIDTVNWWADQAVPERWRSRHSREIVAGDEPDERFQCICPGSRSRPRCALRASQEDRLCDHCREECVAVDEAGRYHRLVDLYGATSG